MTLLSLESFHNKSMDGFLFCRKTHRLFNQIRKSENGISRLRLRTSQIEKRLLVNLVIERIRIKSDKPYPTGTTILLVECNLDIPYSPDEWDHFITMIKRAIPAHPFKEIFLYDSLLLRTETIQGR